MDPLKNVQMYVEAQTKTSNAMCLEECCMSFQAIRLIIFRYTVSWFHLNEISTKYLNLACSFHND